MNDRGSRLAGGSLESREDGDQGGNPPQLPAGTIVTVPEVFSSMTFVVVKFVTVFVARI